MKITRRQLIISTASLATIASFGKFWWTKNEEKVSGKIVGANSKVGHKLRTGNFPEISQTIDKKLVIIGGGIAGLSAAWKLHKSGFTDFVLLELENEVGGNSSYGENSVSAYPWGAHYVPLLTEEATSARELFSDLGIIKGYENGLPIYDEYALSADPNDRLFMMGRWQEGLVPQVGASEQDHKQYKEFFTHTEQLRGAKGSDGRKIFAIPVDKSSTDKKWRKLDKISMAEYLKQNGWDSKYLHWYVNYCCRDDYGANMEDVSAWAGLHYFASRSGKAANADVGSVVTFPEGNGWLVKQLKKQLAAYIKPKSLAFKVSKTKNGAEIEYWDIESNTTTKINAESVIFATPRFIAERLHKTSMNVVDFHYSPWVIANVTVSKLPQGKGVPLSWDNVIYDSELLGYVNATNQNLNHIQRETVLTYYYPLSNLPPKEAREQAIKRSYEQWRDIVLTELLRIHPELQGQVKSLDVWLWGHGMIRPSPDFIWGETRQAALEQSAPFFYAHSDMSGVSIFEEANYHGVKAAENAMSNLQHKFVSSL